MNGAGAADLRAALIGYGLAGEFFHAPLLADAAEVWRDAERFDVAVVAAPNRVHVALTSAAREPWSMTMTSSR